MFTSAEVALLNTTETKTAQLPTKRKKAIKRLQRLIDKPAKFLSTIQVAITILGFLGSAFAAEIFSDIIVEAVVSAITASGK